MKQKFDNVKHKKFIKYFGIKNNETKIEKDFYKTAYKYIKYIKWIPGLKMVAIGNSVSMNSADRESDIDLFIVTSENTMWLNRVIITFIFSILGVRKTDKKHAGMLCLSFFVTSSALNFKDLKIKNDIYLYFWIVYLKPILNYDKTYETFIKENSSWADFSEYKSIIKENKSYIKYTKPIPSSLDSEVIPLKKEEINVLFKIINNLFKKILLPKTIKHYNKIGKPYGIIINDNMLKFHNNDIRKIIKKELDI